MRIKIVTLWLLLITISFSSLNSQNAYLNAKFLGETNIDSLKTELRKVINDPVYITELQSEEIEGLKTFLSFLENPFDNSIEFTKLDIEEALKDADSIKTTKDIEGQADADGDGIGDAFDLCPNEAGYNFMNGCPATLKQVSDFEVYMKSVQKLKNVASDNIKPISLEGVTGFTGNSGLTSVVDGLAKFLVDRSKKEIALTFFENFNDRLNTELEIKFKENGKDVTIKVNPSELMPTTYLLLQSSEAYAIPSMGETWITAFKSDLDNLPLNTLNALKASPEFKESIVGHYTLVIGDLIMELKEGTHPQIIIEKLSEEYNDNKFRIDQFLGAFSLISANIIKGENGDLVWAELNDITSMTPDEQGYFFGWIYQEGRSKNIISSVSEPQIIYADTKLVIQQVDEIKNLFNDIKAIADTKSDDYLLKYSELITSTIESLNGINSLSFIDGTNFGIKSDEFLNKLLPLSKDLNNFLNSISEKSYGKSLIHTLSFLKNITGLENDNKLVKQVSFYGNFLVDMVNASELKDGASNEVTQILDKYALPVSSYRIKRQAKWSIDLNAYPGISANYEFSDSDSGSLGITAPIGFSFSKKNKKDKNESASHSIFLSAIDIGAPFSYRLTNDEAEGLPEEITWEQIFAPGLFYVHGFRNSPFAISVGVQYSPLLRKIEENNVLDEKNIIKVSASLVIDIPMFNLARSSN
ncbi:hypothetical protein [Winogradskyella vincentii]|uniref:Uncharacterized protein n=1 Tax=Winogradskyella vincentii TaxID=2877122 RepID=A0ABS7Y3G1_9FLAO|nr:hypothetical protein [Winogradskyella vincentii]MCA0154459.1 hypothetical protein [Winogradskyella vincentii]